VGREVTDTDDVSKAVDDLNRAWLAAVESQSARIAELKADRDDLATKLSNLEAGFRTFMESHNRVLDENDALAAQIHKALDYMADTSKGDWPISYHARLEQHVRAILDAAPSDILAEHDARVIHEAAEAIRAHATAPTELIHPHVQIDPLIAWVADWMENPPEWVKVSYRKKASKMTETDDTAKLVADPIGEWFRRIGTGLSDADYEEGIRLIYGSSTLHAVTQADLDHRAMASQKAERDSLAAVIEKVRKAFDEYTGYAEICSAVRDILAAAPSGILADLEADVWDEGTSIGVRSILLNSPQLPPNPYRRTEQGEQASE
jgi:hypothetical protein